MRKIKLYYALALAPLLLGGYNSDEIKSQFSDLTVTTLPTCATGQFLVYMGGNVVCQAITGSGLMVPDCKTPGQLLTYTNSGELSAYSCTTPGSIMLSQTDQTTITNLENQLTIIGNQLTQIGMGSRVAARTYRGNTKATTSSAMANGNLTGIAAASAYCAAEFGTGATMCDVYSLYISVAAGKIGLTADIPSAWAYQASWTAPFNATNPLEGVADNCDGDTYGTADQGWRGTTFSLSTAGTSTTDPTAKTVERVPQFVSNTPCGTVLPIACCQ
jgi:hypothetical protein